MKRFWAYSFVSLILVFQGFETTYANVVNKAAKAAKAASKASEHQKKPLDLAPVPSGGAGKGKGADEGIQPLPDPSMPGGAPPGGNLEERLECAVIQSDRSPSLVRKGTESCPREPTISLRREPHSGTGKFKSLEKSN
jgi:hypothetical protein